MKNNERLILVTNDDGINSRGIDVLIHVALEFGKVIVVAPMEGQSGMSHAITTKKNIKLELVEKGENLTRYACGGTPVDCVKMACNVILKGKPDLLLSGINHGSNSSASMLYSGTMAAAVEGAFNNIPSIGFSLTDSNPDADFSASKIIIKKIVQQIINSNSQITVKCININIPRAEYKDIKGIKICRMAKAFWRETFEEDEKGMYMLNGKLVNCEPEADDTDEWALKNNYVSVVPVNNDSTCYPCIETLRKILN